MEKQEPMKYCKHCGGRIPEKAVVCTLCGCQVEAFENTSSAQPQVIINNSNQNSNTNINQNHGHDSYPYKHKWTAFFLCLFLGWVGAHRFYVGKSGTGILWLFTGGFFLIGWGIDLLLILFGSFRDKAGYPLR